MTLTDMGAAAPVLAEVLRGNAVESRRRGSFAVVDAAGRVVSSAGPIEALVFPRSAVKPLQALPLIESGAVERLSLSRKEIALACASHRGEPAHVDAVRSWLAAAGLDADALECGAHPPLGGAAAAALVRQGVAPSPLHNNCSGKHAGFLCTAVHLGENPRGYIQADHPVQRRVTAALAEMTGADLVAAPCGCDGCGIPTYAMPLRAVARGMARMADTAGLGPERARAAAVILDAMAAEPFFVEGTASFVTDCMTVAGHRAPQGRRRRRVCSRPTPPRLWHRPQDRGRSGARGGTGHGFLVALARLLRPGAAARARRLLASRCAERRWA